MEARPNYPCLRDIVPGTVVEFKNRATDCSFLARITTRRVHRDFATMLWKETIQTCLPDHDPEDLQRAVNTYHSFRHDTYKFITRKHGDVSLRFTLCFTENKLSRQEDTTEECGGYDKNSLCSIFEYINRQAFKRKYDRYKIILTKSIVVLLLVIPSNEKNVIKSDKFLGYHMSINYIRFIF